MTKTTPLSLRRYPDSPVVPRLAALLLALYPQAVIYSRFGFSYNLLAPLWLLRTTTPQSGVP